MESHTSNTNAYINYRRNEKLVIGYHHTVTRDNVHMYVQMAFIDNNTCNACGKLFEYMNGSFEIIERSGDNKYYSTHFCDRQCYDEYISANKDCDM